MRISKADGNELSTIAGLEGRGGAWKFDRRRLWERTSNDGGGVGGDHADEADDSESSSSSLHDEISSLTSERRRLCAVQMVGLQ